MTEEDIAQLARNVEKAGVDVQVELGRTTVSLRDLVALQTGDLILFDKPTDAAAGGAHQRTRKVSRVSGRAQGPDRRAGFRRHYERGRVTPWPTFNT